VPAEAHHPEAQSRDAQARAAKVHVLHLILPRSTDAQARDR
jgi:hypothetical protein